MTTIGFRATGALRERLEDQARRQDASLSDVVRNLVYAGLVADAHSLGERDQPVGQSFPMDNTPSFRRGLPAEVAAEILAAHRRLHCSYRAVADAVETDVAHYWRITRGQRCPSPVIAERIIAVLELDHDVADQLREAAAQTSPAMADRLG